MKKKKSKPLTAEHILAWLNGRVTHTIRVAYNGKTREIWNVACAISDGLTIEDAVLLFCKVHKIDIREETGL